MHTSIELDRLVDQGHIPQDFRIVSTNNKIVVVSENEGMVARISKVSVNTERDDPHDLRYSHRVSWLAGTVAPVVQPYEPEPKIVDGHLISRYPLLTTGPVLADQHAEEILDLGEALSDALPVVSGEVSLRRLDIPNYVGDRLKQLSAQSQNSKIDYLEAELTRMESDYPFGELVEADTGLVHGDFKADNLVADSTGSLHAIDLDAASIGPRYFDLAAWRFRCEMGDNAPIERTVELRRKRGSWNEEHYRALIGWKAISSLSFTLLYEPGQLQEAKIAEIIRSGQVLGGLEVA